MDQLPIVADVQEPMLTALAFATGTAALALYKPRMIAAWVAIGIAYALLYVGIGTAFLIALHSGVIALFSWAANAPDKAPRTTPHSDIIPPGCGPSPRRLRVIGNGTGDE